MVWFPRRTVAGEPRIAIALCPVDHHVTSLHYLSPLIGSGIGRDALRYVSG